MEITVDVLITSANTAQATWVGYTAGEQVCLPPCRVIFVIGRFLGLKVSLAPRRCLGLRERSRLAGTLLETGVKPADAAMVTVFVEVI